MRRQHISFRVPAQSYNSFPGSGECGGLHPEELLSHLSTGCCTWCSIPVPTAGILSLV